VQVYRDAARRLGIELLEQVVHTEEEAQATLAAVRKGEVDGILSLTSTTLNIDGFVLEATARQAIPSMFESARDCYLAIACSSLLSLGLALFLSMPQRRR
jgi:hypothetical protein